MSDNIAITAGAGTTVATDEVTRNAILEHEQVIKIALGADGAFDTLIDSGQQTMANSVPVVLASNHSDVPVGGGVAHDAVSSGNPSYLGAEAIAHGTNPTAVAAADRTKLYANRAGVLFVMGGHPNIITIELAFTAAQTDVAIVTIGAGSKIVVTQIQTVTDNANTAFPQIRVGFGTVNTPTTTGVVLTHPGLPAGGGVSRGDGSGILGIGADNEDLRVTAGAPTGGSCRVLVSYHTIES